MSDLNDVTKEGAAKKNRPNPLLLVLGFVVLGAALAFILFGGDLAGSAVRRPISAIESGGVLESIPELEISDPIVAGLPVEGAGLQVGDMAVDFVATDLEGNPVKLSDFKGRPVIINFWATWCAPCRIEMPELQAAYDAHQGDDLVILAVNREEDLATVKEYFIDEMGLSFTPLLDEQAFVANQYRVFNMPSTYFVDRSGEIVAIHRGPLTKGQIEGYLEDTLSSTG